MSFLNKIKKMGGQLAEEGTENDFAGYIDTGSYVFNLLVSGNIFGGFLNNKMTVLAGESSTGKTYLLLAAIKATMEKDKDAICVYFESEGSINKEFLAERGLDISRFIVFPIGTVEEFGTKITNLLDEYMQEDKKTRPYMIIAVDSLGNMPSKKEMDDTADGENKTDMTRAKKIKSIFRIICIKLARAGAAMLVANHTYEGIGMFATKEMSGGTGLRYNASNIVYLSKRKERDGTEVTGNFIVLTNNKSRYGRENKRLETLIDYTSGLVRYHGLLELCEKYGIWTKVGNRYKISEDVLVFKKEINENPEKYFTTDILTEINNKAADFRYGSDSQDDAENQSVSDLL